MKPAEAPFRLCLGALQFGARIFTKIIVASGCSGQ